MTQTTRMRRFAARSARLALLGSLVVAGCAEVPPLETPPELEEMRAEWEAEAGDDPVPPESAVDAEAPEAKAEAAQDDDYTIDVPPAHPGEPLAAAGPSESRARPAREAGTEDDDSVIRVDSAGRARQPRSLWEASVAAKERRKEAPTARIAINDENLHEYQEGSVTVGGSTARPDDGTTEAESATAPFGEEYWRSRVLDLRTRLRAAVDEMAELEERSADLRRSFYAQDDPYVRDGEIKPAWDRALDRMEETRGEILAVSRELDAALEEGRRAGALPGWLREGSELEPEPDELPRDLRSETPRAHEPEEPYVIEIEEQEPPG